MSADKQIDFFPKSKSLVCLCLYQVNKVSLLLTSFSIAEKNFIRAYI